MNCVSARTIIPSLIILTSCLNSCRANCEERSGEVREDNRWPMISCSKWRKDVYVRCITAHRECKLLNNQDIARALL